MSCPQALAPSPAAAFAVAPAKAGGAPVTIGAGASAPTARSCPPPGERAIPPELEKARAWMWRCLRSQPAPPAQAGVPLVACPLRQRAWPPSPPPTSPCARTPGTRTACPLPGGRCHLGGPGRPAARRFPVPSPERGRRWPDSGDLASLRGWYEKARMQPSSSHGPSLHESRTTIMLHKLDLEMITWRWWGRAGERA